jgi:hypothetical protein
MVHEPVRRHGRADVGLPAGPDFFRFSDIGENLRSLLAAGFKDVRSGVFEQFWRFTDPNEVFETLIHGTVRTGALLRAQTPAALRDIKAEIALEAASYKVGQEYLLPMSAVLAVGKKP